MSKLKTHRYWLARDTEGSRTLYPNDYLVFDRKPSLDRGQWLSSNGLLWSIDENEVETILPRLKLRKGECKEITGLKNVRFK